MKKSRILFILLALALAFSSMVAIFAAAEETETAEAPYEYVVVLGVDGMGNFITDTDTPNIDKMFAGGATTGKALVENPSASAQGWGSLLTGAVCTDHGMTNYTIQDAPYANEKYPTIFKLIREERPDAKLVSFCSWNSINTGIVEDSAGVVETRVADANMGTAVSEYFTANGAPDFLFCQFNNSDAVGHASGYGSPKHLECITATDSYIGDVYKAYEDAGLLDKTLFIVTSDHGGTLDVAADGTTTGTHGGWSDRQKYVFYGIAGKGVGNVTLEDMYIRDTAAIVAYALGVKGNEIWDSYVPAGVFADNMSPLSRPASAPDLVYPSETPGADSEKYIGNYIDLDELRAGFFFDSDLSNFVPGSDVELKRLVGAIGDGNIGTVYYPIGLYGDGVRLSYEGYLATDDLKFDTGSFSISMWLKPDAMTSGQPFWSTKIWSTVDGISGSDQQGVVVRNYYTNNSAHLGFSVGSGAWEKDGVAQKPTHVNYNNYDINKYEPGEWINALMVVDREAGTLKYYINFELATTYTLTKYSWYSADYDFDPHDILAIGQDVTGTYGRSMEGMVDDLLIWNKAIGADTVSGLTSYYEDAIYDYNYKLADGAGNSTAATDEVTVSSGTTNTDLAPFTKFESTALGAALTDTAKYQIGAGFALSEYTDPKYYVVDFDIATESVYLPMNFVSIIAGDKGTAYLESASNRITEDGVLVGSINGNAVTRTLSISPYDWQHITLVYDLVGGDDGYPLYIYLDGDLVSNAEWIEADPKANGEVPSAISSTCLMIETYKTNAEYYATALIANAVSALYTDDTYGNLGALLSSGASMLEANKIFDLTYGKDYALPTPDNMFTSGGVGYRTLAEAIAGGDGTVDIVHNDYFSKHTVNDPCTVNTNGYVFDFEYTEAVTLSEAVDPNGEKVYVFTARSPLYTITDSDGKVNNYYSDTTLDTLLTDAPDGSTIKLFADVDLPSDFVVNGKTVSLDLNKNTVTNSAGFIRLYDKSGINIFGGTIDDSLAKEFIYVGNGAEYAVINITDCDITASKNFAELRTGTLNLTDCTYKHVENFGRFVNVASGSNKDEFAILNVDGCTMDLGSARFVYCNRAASYPQAVDVDVTVSDSDIKTTGDLFYLYNVTADDENTADVIEGAAGSSTDITITGSSKISCKNFDGGNNTVPKTTLTLGLGTVYSVLPEITGVTPTYSDGGIRIGGTTDASYPYTVTNKPILYSITSSDGTVTEYDTETTLDVLVDSADSGSTIKLFTDIDIVSKKTISKNITVDLNKFTVSNSAGYIRLSNKYSITFMNGKIEDSASFDFVYIGYSASLASYNFVNCTITGRREFAEFRSGTLTMTDCIYTHADNFDRVVNFSSSSSTGDSATVIIDGCTMNLGSAFLAIHSRDVDTSYAVGLSFTVNDSEISTTGSLFKLYNRSAEAADSTLDIKISGESKIACASFDAGGLTVGKTTLELGADTLYTVEPKIEGATLKYPTGATGIKYTEGEEYPYSIGMEDCLYSITAGDGTVTRYYEEMSLYDLVALAVKTSGSVITLYADIDQSTASICYVNTKLTIDLNGHKISNTGDRIRINGGDLILKNGTLDDCGTTTADGKYDDNDFINFGNGATGEVLIDNCDIIANGYFIDLRGGKVTVRNSTFVQGGKLLAPFAYMASAGSSAALVIEGCEIDLGTAHLVKLRRTSASYATAVTVNISVKDTVIKTTGDLFDLTNTVSAQTSETHIGFSGATYLTFNTLDGETNTVSNTTISFGTGVKLTSVPTLALGTVAFADGGKAFMETGDTDHPYVVTDKDLLYKITESDGTVKSYYTELAFSELVALAGDGSTITLYTDIAAHTSTADFTVGKNISLNLNGFAITSSARMRPTKTVYIYGGTINDGGVDFVFFGTGNKTALFKVDDCTINVNGKLVHARSGSVEITNSTIGGEIAGLFLVCSVGTSATVSLDNCTVDLGSSSLFSISRSAEKTAATTPTLNLNNCTVTTTGYLFYLENLGSPDTSTVRINITGDKTKLSFGNFDNDSCTVKDTIVTLGLGVKMNNIPSLAIGSVELGEGAKGIVLTEDASYPYLVSDKTSLSAKPYFSLTLYSDFTLNLCFRESEAHNILKVTVGGVEITPFTESGMVFYPIRDISAYTAAETKVIEVDYLMGDIELSTTLEYSVVDYAKGLLASTFSTESKEMISRAIDYVKIAYEYAGESLPVSLTELLASDAYKAISAEENVAEIPESSTDVGGLGSVISSAQIDLGSSLKFRFNIKAGVSASLTVKTATVDESYEIVDGKCDGNSFIEVKMRAFDMYSGVITLKAGENVGTYDLKAYAHSDALEKDETGILDELLLAMYNYCREANEYMKVQDKDFRSTASVVVKDGKEGTVTFVLDDGKADTSDVMAELLPKYENLKATFAIIPKALAALHTEYNEETGKYEYVFDENGKYVYTLNEEVVEYWRSILEAGDGRFEIMSHTMTHSFWGLDDNGGIFTYVKSDGTVVTSAELPAGSVTAEIYAAAQILEDVFGIEASTVVLPGIGISQSDVVIDGVTYKSPYHAFFETVSKAYADGTLIGMRGNGFAGVNVAPDRVITPEYLATVSNRIAVEALTVRNTNDVSLWLEYIDYARELGGWAPFCLHRIVPDTDTETSYLNIFLSQAEELFAYANAKNVWVANYTEATKYYTEWSTAEVSSVYDNGMVKVTLTDGENDELFDEALTVRVTVPTSWDVCIVNGAAELTVMTDASGEAYVLVDIVPDSGAVTLTEK